MAGARAYECVYCHDLDRSHAINDVTKNRIQNTLVGETSREEWISQLPGKVQCRVYKRPMDHLQPLLVILRLFVTRIKLQLSCVSYY